MFWADRIAEEIEKRLKGSSGPLLIRDEKTVSGRVHIGSMRGVAIHGAVAEALAEKNIPNEFLYEMNDFDVMDSVPSYLPTEVFEPHLGKLLKDAPSPEAGFESYADYFAKEFQGVIEAAGWRPKFYRGSELYLSGKMDDVIREALTAAEKIRDIYKEVSGSSKEGEWLPLSMICPQCKKLATTEASDFDGTTVAVHCRENKIEWTKGCGFEGRLSPFGGTAKLPWKVEWAAKWKVMKVQVEGGGKDHSTKGGARDVANHISKEVFGYEPPFDIPYEFILVGGKKMSSSKGRGSSAKEISELLPAKLFRFALLHKDISQQFNFDPEGDTIPILYDLYDKFAETYWQGVTDDYSRLFKLAHSAGAVPERLFLPRFSHVAFLVQMPHLGLEEEVARMKGSPLTPEDNIELAERAAYAKKWLELYAPEKFVFKLQKEFPEAARGLSEAQKKAMVELARRIIEESAATPDGESLHHALHEIKETQGISPAELFSAVYLLFLGKSHGPKAGWFLSVLDRAFVLKRLKEASN